MRRALLSAFVGLAGAAAVAASGWALQAAALPPPTSGARVAADASAWFHDYRLVVDEFHFHHRRTSGACLRHMSVSRAYAANQPAIGLKVSRGPDKRLTLYVSPRTYRPLVAIVAVADQEATARLYLSRVRPPVLAHFHLLRYAEPGGL